jgi:fatty acid desaturase
MATSRVGKSVWAMKAQLARFVIFQIAMLIALVFFVTMDVGWLSAVLIVISVIAGLSLSDLAFHRLADPETIQRDLEERVRNQHL